MAKKTPKTVENRTKMPQHCFFVEDAEKYGAEAAILLYNIKYWVDFNLTRRENIYDGYCWTYNSAKAYGEQFPYFSEDKIQRLLKFLEDEKAIISSSYNKHKYDRTKWYSIPEKVGIHSADLRDVFHGTAEPIPDINTDIETDINTDVTGHVTGDDFSYSNIEKTVLVPVMRDTTPEYLINIGEGEIQYLTKYFKVTRSELVRKAEQLYNWCKSKGKKYQFYRPLLHNALDRDFGKRDNTRKNNPALL